VRSVAAAIIVKKIVLLRVSRLAGGGGLDKDDVVFKPAIGVDEIGCVRESLSALVLLFGLFYRRALWRTVDKLDVARDGAGVYAYGRNEAKFHNGDHE
jgi:hypothetical protein